MTGFRIAAAALDPEHERLALLGPESGGYVSFEGWVRNRNDGRDVLRLEYQAYEALALKEGNRIVATAAELFPIDAALCVHRVGKLEIGDLAVWVGVSAGHRDEAFRACRYRFRKLPCWVRMSWGRQLCSRRTSSTALVVRRESPNQ